MEHALTARIAEVADQVGDLLEAASEEAASALASARDIELLELVTQIERLGRFTDALRVHAAGEVEHRSRPSLGHEGLAAKKGCTSAVELVERLTRVSRQTARARLKLGAAVRRTSSLLGIAMPPRFERVAAGFHTGELGIDSAVAITTALNAVLPNHANGDLDGVRAAEHELVCAAIGVAAAPGAEVAAPATATETRMQAAVWAEVLDPDGAEPSHRQWAARGFEFLPARDGLVPVRGALLPEVAGIVRRVFDSITNFRQSAGFMPIYDHDEAGSAEGKAERADDGSNETGSAHTGSAHTGSAHTGSAHTGSVHAGSAHTGSAHTESVHAESEASGRKDPRTPAQRQHDAIATVFDIAARADELPTLGGASPTLVVTVLTDDFRAGHGVGHVDGIDEPISMRAVEQHASANGIQRVTLAANGQIVGIGTTERRFNRAQRRALAVRDGGCIIPGCDTPAWATEAHHVIPWWHGGPTHTENGVLLCWFHHRSIDSSGWRIRIVNGAPEVMPPPGMGPQQWRGSTVSPARRAAALARRRAGPAATTAVA
ncbi:HNH endonuclease signature motif containing protein [Agromyces laixinhei]|uniref:HNH endonuclease signature motif containing protein n=1 Tax=Agromyces laixinhei TaxID=2585717 RepID=UPI0018DC8A7F|nr:HNH endonuclease signature motif containing protein [Agromyces laixinhei]